MKNLLFKVMTVILIIAMWLVALTFLSKPVHAVEIETAIGISHYTDRGDGYWYQDAFQHELKLTAPTFEIGVTQNVYQQGNSGLDLHADWIWLGTIHTQAWATGDSNYNLQKKGCNGACWPLADFLGSGHDQGFKFSPEAFYDIGEWRFGTQIGAFIHKPLWSEHVVNWISSPTAVPQTINVKNSNVWQIDPFLELSVGKGNYKVSAQYLINQEHENDPWGAIWHRTYVVSIGYKF